MKPLDQAPSSPIAGLVIKSLGIQEPFRPPSPGALSIRGSTTWGNKQFANHPDALLARPSQIFISMDSSQSLLCIYKHIHRYICIHIHVYMHAYVYIFVCIYVYIYIYISLGALQHDACPCHLYTISAMTAQLATQTLARLDLVAHLKDGVLTRGLASWPSLSSGASANNGLQNNRATSEGPFEKDHCKGTLQCCVKFYVVERA